MKLPELKATIQQYQYLEDTKLIDVCLASIIATRLKLGDPIWLIIIGASSGGKSQILRPLALTDPKFLHRVDDLTENTFLSGAKSKEGEISLLHRIGSKGMIVVSDFTVLFSKQSEARATILSQFRMLYDGEMTKFSGNQSKPITWKGYLGVLAGSTPSIYAHFEEVADMGERFLYYRMKDYDPHKATHLALTRKMFGKDLDDELSTAYAQYIKDVVMAHEGLSEIEMTEEVKERIIEVATFAEKIRTVAHKDYRKDIIDRIPVSAMPMRVALQLVAIAKGLAVIRHFEENTFELSKSDLEILDWCGYSLANEEKRAVLKALASIPYDITMTTSSIADRIGLATSVCQVVCQNLTAVGVLDRDGDSNSLRWKFKDRREYDIVRRIEHIEVVMMVESREALVEEEESIEQSAIEMFMKD